MADFQDKREASQEVGKAQINPASFTPSMKRILRKLRDDGSTPFYCLYFNYGSNTAIAARRQLVAYGLVEHDSGRNYQLTDEGRKIAEGL